MTLFSCPKPFGCHHTGVIQWNAIRSWTLLDPRPDIVLLGNEAGTEEICRELNIRHIGGVASTSDGLPLLDDLFRKAQATSAHEYMCYINADIILMQDFLGAIAALRQWKSKWVMIGARTDIEIHDRLNFQDPNWQEVLERRAKELGSFMTSGTDYVVFPVGFYESMPDFVLGRTAFDNWLLWFAVHQGVPLVDATGQVRAVHQSHSFATDWAKVVKSAEAARNRQLAGRWPLTYTPADATHRIESGAVRGTRLRHFQNRAKVLKDIGRGHLVRNNWVRAIFGKPPLARLGH